MASASPKKGATYWQEKFSPYLVGSVNGDNEQRGYCPIHEDPAISNSPSASFNYAKSVFYCASSCGGMSFTNLLNSIREDEGLEGGASDEPPSRPGSRSRVRSIEDAPTKRGKTKPLPSEEKIAEWTSALLSAPGVLKVMTDRRGLTAETIQEFELGWDGERYTIPIRDAEGVLINIRRYDPDAKDAKDKMVSWGYGWGEGRIYGLDTLRDHDEVVFTEGEMDRIINMQHGIPSVCSTSGASVFKPEWLPPFEGKVIFVCYDKDTAGDSGSMKACILLGQVAEAVYQMRLPGDAKGFDVTDYYVSQGYTGENFRALMDEHRTQPFGKKAKDEVRLAQPAKQVTLEGSMSSEHGRDPIEITATIAGKVQPAYLLPKRVEFTCDGSYGDKCKGCPIGLRGNHDTLVIGGRDEVLLEFLNQPTDWVRKRLLKEVGAPVACPKVDVDEPEQWNVEELVLIPSVDARGEEAQNPISRKAFNVGPYGTNINTTAKVIGVNTTDPKTRRALLQTWECEQTETDLDRFAMTPEIQKELSVFQVDGDQTPLAKMEDIARDLSTNVTRIYGRMLLHMAYDVVWHSVLGLRLNVGSSRVDLQACKLEYSIVSPK